MKLQQLRCVAEIVRQGNHLSAAAEALHTSQPGVSRQIRLLESELGFEIFVRTRNRIIGLTEPGEHVLAIAKRVTADLESLRSLKEDLQSKDKGRLTVATTHTQARYVLPRVIKSFIGRNPGVELILKQGDPEQICHMVEDGEADVAFGGETISTFPSLLKLPCFELSRCVVGPSGHPIFSLAELTLADVAAYPIITYDPRYSGRWKVMDAFKKGGFKPRIMLSAVDADVCKTYVSLGLGLAILPNVAYDSEHDEGLVARDASHIFASTTSSVAIKPTTYVRSFVLDFISLIAGHLTPKSVRRALRTAALRENAGEALTSN